MDVQPSIHHLGRMLTLGFLCASSYLLDVWILTSPCSIAPGSSVSVRHALIPYCTVAIIDCMHACIPSVSRSPRHDEGLYYTIVMIMLDTYRIIIRNQFKQYTLCSKDAKSSRSVGGQHCDRIRVYVLGDCVMMRDYL